MESIWASIQSTPIQPTEFFDKISHPSCGGLASFLGVVRDNHAGKKVTGITYDVFEPFAEKVLQEICQAEKKKHNDALRIFVTHYKGYLDVGQISLALGVAAPHRDAAFVACRDIVENIKHFAPIWKKEHYEDGSVAWLKGHAILKGKDKEGFLEI